MESLILSNHSLTNLDLVDIDIKQSSKTVVYLDLSNNFLDDFKVSYNFTNLQVLSLDNNRISSIKNLPCVLNLDTLSINNNAIQDVIEFAAYASEKFPNLKMLNTLQNPMNPGFQKYNDYIKYRNIVKSKLKYLEYLDGIGVNDTASLNSYKPKASDVNLVTGNNKIFNNTNLTTIEEGLQYSSFNQNKNKNYNTSNNENDELEDLNKLITNKKRHSSITFSQRMLRKADNLTKFNRKNHSEGNKHITNDYL